VSRFATALLSNGDDNKRKDLLFYVIRQLGQAQEDSDDETIGTCRSIVLTILGLSPMLAIAKKDDTRRNLVHEAAAYGAEAIIPDLIEAMKKNSDHESLSHILGAEDSGSQTALSVIVHRALAIGPKSEGPAKTSKRAMYIKVIELVLVVHKPVDEKLTNLMQQAIRFNDLGVFKILLRNRFDLLNSNVMPHIITCGQFEIWKAVAHQCSEIKLELLCLAVQFGQVEIVDDLTKQYPALVRELDKNQLSIFWYVSERSRDDAWGKIRNMLVPAVIKDTEVSMEKLRRYLGELDGK
jgi:hypothetical protein